MYAWHRSRLSIASAALAPRARPRQRERRAGGGLRRKHPEAGSASRSGAAEAAPASRSPCTSWTAPTTSPFERNDGERDRQSYKLEHRSTRALEVEVDKWTR
eukprot:scaffold302174_cov28-Tisochrysis_lutea.AAC.1